MQGFKTYELGGVRVSANDTVGVDVVLEVGAQTETINVTASREIIRTETGAREGVITPEQIENISIIGRNPLELLRTLPGIVPPEQGQFEKQGIGAGFGAGDDASASTERAPRTWASPWTAPTCATSATTAPLNVPNNEFVAEVKVQTSNYAAEFGTAAVNVQAVTKSGSSEFHGIALRLPARQQVRGERPRAQLRGPGPAEGQVPVSRLHPVRSRSSSRAPTSTRTGTRLLLLRLGWQRQTLAPDPIFDVVPTAAMRARPVQQLRRRPEPEPARPP